MTEMLMVIRCSMLNVIYGNDLIGLFLAVMPNPH